MASAKRCDRCGAYYQERETTAIEDLASTLFRVPANRVQTQQSVIEKLLDFCPRCSASLTRWLKEEEG